VGAKPVTAGEIEAAFLQADIAALSPGVYEQFLGYFTVLLRWNAKLNLTAIREPEQIVRRHFVECAFAAQHLPQDVGTLLDYGSGAGLPGLVIAICRPEIRVTLAESQGKKASFLREAARTVGVSTEVYDGRVETMAQARQFDAVTMRAVEKMELALPIAIRYIRRYLALFTTQRSSEQWGERWGSAFRQLSSEFTWREPISLPNADQRILVMAERI
jgi:16S rRNA (guanine527-N7)-methyltransferase